MMTRRATVKDMEEKLRATLRELESTKTLCKQLLQERDDSEVEVKNIIDKNTSLKSELAELHIQYMDVLDHQHTQLQQEMSSFHQCSDTHEVALQRITELEQELCNAHKAISILECGKISEQVTNTCNLFDELVACRSNKLPCKLAETIDLTGDDTIPICPVVMSHNKLKKYIKINKFIRRSKRYLKKQNLLKLNILLRKDRVSLTKTLSSCTAELEYCKSMYEIETQQLQQDLKYKESLLKDIFSKYESSQEQLSKRLFEAVELMDLVKSNTERYESLTNSLSCDVASQPSPLIPLSEISVPTPAIENIHIQKLNTLLFTDALGAGFGKILHNYLSHHFTNHSYHDITFKQIVEKIGSTKLDSNSIIVLLLGSSSGTTKEDIVKGIDTLLSLNIGKLMLCAFPYSDSFSEYQNKCIFNLNNTLHMLTCCHSDKLLYIIC
ncbi:uncharacterized protein LOC135116837 [Helicoverpa armigera]|uniref:uncharacterized protein LOC135116837 n=1 Tax=Helicoverpa armigera TaxID=29058 RepID=UPI0030837144